jgi:hypothetical protein
MIGLIGKIDRVLMGGARIVMGGLMGAIKGRIDRVLMGGVIVNDWWVRSFISGWIFSSACLENWYVLPLTR